jgi:hypothetical protein
VLRRLVYAKYLLWKAGETIDSKSPLAHALGVLPLQDSAEMFLRTIADALQVALKTNCPFNAIIDAINASPNSKGIPVPYANELNRLNTIRVNFKHHGIEPTAKDVNDCRRDTERFAGDGLRIYLGQSLDELSLALLVRHRQVQKGIKDAEGLFAKDDHDGATRVCANTFAVLVHTFQNSVLSRRFPPRVSNVYVSGGDPNASVVASMKKVLEYHDDLLERQDHLLTMTLHGLDLSEYFRFISATPHPGRGKLYGASRQGKASREDAQFAIRFLTDAALTLESSPIRRRTMQRPEPPRHIRVLKATVILLWPGGEKVELREAEKDEILEGSFKERDVEGYVAVIQDEGIAFVSADAVEETPPQPATAP